MAGPAAAAQAPAGAAERPAAPAAPASSSAKPPQTPAAPAAAPQPVPFPADARIAIINMATILNGSKLGQGGQAVLQAANDKWLMTLQALAARVQTLQKEYQSGAGTLSTSALTTKKSELDKAQLELQYQQRERDADMQQISQRLSDDFDSKVNPIIEAIRAERKLLMIFDLTDMGSITVVASHPGLDLSAEVIRRLDAR
jgi:Skp family chaperone for outer membrane proteins